MLKRFVKLSLSPKFRTDTPIFSSSTKSASYELLLACCFVNTGPGF